MKDVFISDSIVYVGVDDKNIDLFESQYVVPNGVSYNSYVILDDKITIMDTVDRRGTEGWLANLKETLGDKKPYYVVVSHLEPDHAGNLKTLLDLYPDIKVIGNPKTFTMIAQFFDVDLSDDRKVVVGEGDTVNLGTHTLQFFMAPLVHWPEVMVAYEQSEKILFSADGFGKFGATENVILAAVYARGRTRIENCAKEPEIAELCRFLREKGAKIEGEGTSCILVEGVSHLRDSTYTLMPDRIVAGTYLFAAAATRGEICLEGMRPSDMESVLDVLGRMGAVYENREDGFYLDGRKAINPLPVVCTETYPGFPTDLQSQLLATLCVARGRSVIRECIFEERFRIAPWLNRMGADVTTDGREAVIEGKAHLSGQMVKAQELRGGAALVIAALMAQGITRVYGSAFIERGYEDLAGDLRKLGAVISKKKAER